MKDRIITASIIIFAVMVFWFADSPQGRVYDCTLAEWHPDYPKEVKEECRQLNDEYRRQQEKKDSKIYI